MLIYEYQSTDWRITMKAYERLLKYVTFRTPSDESSETTPYKINSIEWDGEEYKENGILCRNAVAKGNKVVNDYTSLYGGDVYLPAHNLAYKYVA